MKVATQSVCAILLSKLSLWLSFTTCMLVVVVIHLIYTLEPYDDPVQNEWKGRGTQCSASA